MNKKEFTDFATTMRTYYPREQLFATDQAFALWYEQIAEFPAAAVDKALKHWARHNKWSPTIAEIRELAADYEAGRILDWNEAQEVRRILDNKKRQEQFEKAHPQYYVTHTEAPT